MVSVIFEGKVYDVNKRYDIEFGHYKTVNGNQVWSTDVKYTVLGRDVGKKILAHRDLILKSKLAPATIYTVDSGTATHTFATKTAAEDFVAELEKKAAGKLYSDIARLPPQKTISLLQIDTGMANMSSYNVFVNNLNKNPRTRAIGSFLQGITKQSVVINETNPTNLGEMAQQFVSNVKTNWNAATPSQRLGFIVREVAEYVLMTNLINLAGRFISSSIKEIPKWTGKTITIAAGSKGATFGKVTTRVGRALAKAKQKKIWIEFIGASQSAKISKALKITKVKNKVVAFYYKPISKAIRVGRTGIKRVYSVEVRALTQSGKFLSKELSKKAQYTFGITKPTFYTLDEFTHLVNSLTRIKGQVPNSLAREVLIKMGVKPRAVTMALGKSATVVDDIAKVSKAWYSRIPVKYQKILKKTKLWKIIKRQPKPTAKIITDDLLINLQKSKSGKRVLQNLKRTKLLTKSNVKAAKTLSKANTRTLAKAIARIEAAETLASVTKVKKYAQRIAATFTVSKVAQKKVSKKRIVKKIKSKKGVSSLVKPKPKAKISATIKAKPKARVKIKSKTSVKQKSKPETRLKTKVTTTTVQQATQKSVLRTQTRAPVKTTARTTTKAINRVTLTPARVGITIPFAPKTLLIPLKISVIKKPTKKVQIKQVKRKKLRRLTTKSLVSALTKRKSRKKIKKTKIKYKKKKKKKVYTGVERR
jgi:hypothetical protein